MVRLKRLLLQYDRDTLLRLLSAPLRSRVVNAMTECSGCERAALQLIAPSAEFVRTARLALMHIA